MSQSDLVERQSRSTLAKQKGRSDLVDTSGGRSNWVDPYDSIIAVDEGCQLIDNSSKKSISSVVRSLSKQSLKKILSGNDDQVDNV